MTRAYWKNGAIIGFLFIPLLFSIGMFLIMPILAMFRQETLAGIFDALAMLPLVPALFILNTFGFRVGKSGFSYFITVFLTSIIVWTVIGASIGYLIDRRKIKIAKIK
ncbi:MAG: hypothetical protein ACE5HH_00080 [Candidatus Hydrothermarchaeales archaeon]